MKPLVATILKFFSCLLYILTVVSAYGGNVDPAQIATPSLLCLIMPYLALATVIVTILWAIGRNVFFTMAGAVSLIICIPSMSNVMPMGYKREATEGAQKFKIISWNVLHTQDVRQPEFHGNRAIDFMINSEADIICLAELKGFNLKEMPNSTVEMINSLHMAYPYHAGLGWTDLKVLSKYPVDRMPVPEIDWGKESIRFDFFKVCFPKGKILIVAMVHLYSYGLSDDERNVVTEINSISTAEKSVREFKGTILDKLKNAFRRRAQNARLLRKALDSIPESTPLIVCGDFNDVPSSWAYNIVKGEDLRDAYAETNFGPAFTYNLHKFYFHIDQMLYRGRLRALDLNIGKIDSSDHYPLIAEFEFTNTTQYE